MILSGQEISRISNVKSNPMIVGFNSSNVRGSSYDLTVGGEYYLGGDGGDKKLPLSVCRLFPGQAFIIPAHGICYILCEEKLILPVDVTAKVCLRMKCIYGGLILPAQPPFDPGYSGKVIIMVHNLSSSEYSIRQGERVATIEFSQVYKPMPKAPNQIGVRDLQSQLTTRMVSSLSGINDMAESAKKKVDNIYVIFVAFISILVALPLMTFYTVLNDRISDYKSRAEDQYKVNEEQNKTILALQDALRKQEKVLGDYTSSLKEQGEVVQGLRADFSSRSSFGAAPLIEGEVQKSK
ncbi:dCTP deaminase domain-containing protein [Pseudomonas monsensis]